MRCIIAGSRTIYDYYELRVCMYDIVNSDWPEITEVVSGGAVGVDSLGERWALSHNRPVHRMLADWNRYGRVAGMKRNEAMADYATYDGSKQGALVLLWDGKSPGSRNMLETAVKRGMLVHAQELRVDG